jgi:hypothetical protein
MGQRSPAPGAKVLAIAGALAGARLGFSPSDAAAKNAYPGAYHLISHLIAAFINRKKQDLKPLVIDHGMSLDATMNWHGQLVNNYITSDISDSTQQQIINEEPQSYISLSDIEQIAIKLVEVDSCAINENQLELILTKPAAKPLPKQVTFSINTDSERGFIFNSRLLDLSIKSHKSKLTGKRTLAALVYQTEQGSTFRFETKEEEHFSAQIILTQEISQQTMQTALKRLLDCHTWMKTTIK